MVGSNGLVALWSQLTKGERMRRLLLAGVVLAFPLAGLTVGLAGPASASVVNAKQPGVTCTKIKANITGTTAKLKGWLTNPTAVSGLMMAVGDCKTLPG